MGYDKEKYNTRGYITTYLFFKVGDKKLNTLAQEIDTIADEPLKQTD